MKHFLTLFCLLGSLMGELKSQAFPESNYLIDELYIVYRAEVNPFWPQDQFLLAPEAFPELKPFIETAQLYEVENSFYFAEHEFLQRTLRIRLGHPEKRDWLLEQLSHAPRLQIVEKIPLDQIDLVPNDNLYTQQWAPAHVNAELAWNLETGSGAIDIAIVDDAIETSHPDLAPNLIAGRDVADNDNNPNPPNNTYDHGTHVAGTAGAKTNNGIGVASIGSNIDLIPIKATNNTNSITHGYAGIAWAAQNGAEIISCSWGGGSYSSVNQAVIDFAWNQGCIIVASAGNNNQTSPHYPAAYNHVMAVANSNQSDGRHSTSNYGTWVDVTAPGRQIYSTEVGQSYGTKTGTSMAAPMVSSLLGLVWSVNPSASQNTVINCVLNNTAPLSWSGGGSGRIDALAAVQCAIGSGGGGGSSPNLTCNGFTIDDDAQGGSNGDGDGTPEAGETIEVDLDVLNTGQATATNIVANASTNSPYITIIDPNVNINDLTPGASDTGSDFDFDIASSTPNGTNIVIQVQIVANQGTWNCSFNFIVGSGGGGGGTPNLTCNGFTIDDDAQGGSNGDGDGTPEAGETIEVDLDVLNTGQATATNIVANASTNSPYITIIDPNVNISNLNPGSSGLGASFEFAIAQGTPDGTSVTISIQLNANEGSWNCNFSFTVFSPPQTFLISTQASPLNGGTTLGGGSFTAGTGATVSAQAATGYRFKHWEENGVIVSTGLQYTFTVASNRTLSAIFEQEVYAIHVSIQPTNGGTVTGTGNYASGVNVNLNATPSAGYTFLHYLENGVIVGTQTVLRFPASAHRTLTAVFSPNPNTGLEKAFPKGSIEVYPNPSHGAFTLRLNLKGTEELHIQLVNLLGQAIHERKWQAGVGSSEQQIEGIAPGLYVLHLISQSGMTFQTQVWVQ